MGSSGAQARQAQAYAGEISAQAAWDCLARDKAAVLIDVRTPPEWAFSGEPDLKALGKEQIRLSWKIFPSYSVNERFTASLLDGGVPKDATLLFLCRTGGRSLDAAIAVTAQGFSRCYNVTDGFEGPADEHQQRGHLAGWKAAGLPWRQS